MKVNRKLLALSWSIASVCGILFRIFGPFVSDGVLVLLYYFTGFHVPQDALYWFTLFGAFSDHPEYGVLYVLIAFVFVVFWIISLFRLQRGFMFERMIFADRVLSFLMLALTAILQGSEFDVWWVFLLPAAEILVLTLIALKMHGSYPTAEQSAAA